MVVTYFSFSFQFFIIMWIPLIIRIHGIFCNCVLIFILKQYSFLSICYFPVCKSHLEFLIRPSNSIITPHSDLQINMVGAFKYHWTGKYESQMERPVSYLNKSRSYTEKRGSLQSWTHGLRSLHERLLFNTWLHGT